MLEKRMEEDTELKDAIVRQIPGLRRYALALAGTGAEADDLVQDCMERAMRKRHLWRRTGSVRAWLCRMMFNIFLNDRRRDKRQRTEPFDEFDGSHAPNAPRQEAHLECRDINDAVQSLPVSQRSVLVLVAVEGCSYDEAANILDIPIGTVRSRLARARECLDALWPASERSNMNTTHVTPLRRVK